MTHQNNEITQLSHMISGLRVNARWTAELQKLAQLIDRVLASAPVRDILDHNYYLNTAKAVLYIWSSIYLTAVFRSEGVFVVQLKTASAIYYEFQANPDI